MKVYTKTGDKGQTSLIGGKRVSKNHPRVETYGTVDELMAHTALLMDMITDESEKEFLLWVLDRLMAASSLLAAEGEVKKRLPAMTTADVARLERRIDDMDEKFTGFVLPGGNIASSQSHVARTVCRRAERNIVGLTEAGYDVQPGVSEFVNRLSDYFFVLSQKIAKDSNITTKKWKPVVD